MTICYNYLRTLVLGLCISVFLLISVAAAADIDAAVKAKIVDMLKSMSTNSISAINVSPIDGFYEILIDGKQIIYVNPTSGLIIAGQVFSKDGVNLTSGRINEIFSTAAKNILQTIDKTKSIKIGSGPIEVIEFTDVDCPFCRKSEQYFTDKGSYFTRYVFLTPLQDLHPDAVKKSLYILNSDRPEEAYKKMITGAYDDKIPTFTESSKSKETIAYLNTLLQRYSVISTPTFVWSEGYAQGLDTKALNTSIERLKVKPVAVKQE